VLGENKCGKQKLPSVLGKHSQKWLEAENDFSLLGMPCITSTGEN